MQNSSSSSPVVVDANIAVWMLVPTAETDTVIPYFSDWQQTLRPLYAPALWLPECTSVIRRYIHAGKLPTHSGNEALSSLFALEVQIVEADESQCQNALEWAGRLDQTKACDGFYLALAEKLNAEFFTADRHLVNSARQAGIDWVQLVSATG